MKTDNRNFQQAWVAATRGTGVSPVQSDSRHGRDARVAHQRNIEIRALSIAMFAMFFLPAIASAHAFLDHADPKVGSTVNTAPTRITLYFTQQLEPAFSTVTVLNANGKQVDSQDVKIDPKDASIMTVSVPSLTAGTFKVEWKVTSVDTHKTHGSFTFTVQPKQ